MRNAARFLPLALLAATPALAQQKEPTAYDRAIAAGYKALTLCSGIFNAGRTQQQIEALELTGIYPEYDAIVPTLTAEIRKGGYTALVSVSYDDKLPPRAATWFFDQGCKIMPIGQRAELMEVGFRMAPATRIGKHDQQRWPQGEVGVPTSDAIDARIEKPFKAAMASEYGTGTRTTAMIVVQDGKIVSEQYRDGFGPHVSQRTWSVAKSLTGTLVGIAVHKGLFKTDQPTGIPEWQRDNGWRQSDPRADIRLDQLLRMASGLHSSTAGNRTDSVYFGGTTVTEETTSWPLDAKPGTRFRYANNDILLAMRALRAKSPDTYDRFPQVEFFDKIGMTRTIAETDWQGNFILSSQVWSTARDLARFGLLYLNDGVWNGERLLPEGWVKYVTTPSGPQPPEGDFGYGATFWLLNKSPGVPADTYAAFGNRGQYVVIVPSRKVVIVRRAEDPAGARFDIAKFTADVLAALK